MLNDEDINKLCSGRIILAEFLSSNGRDSAGDHYAIMLEDNETIKENDEYYVVLISHNTSIDPHHLVPVPNRLGYTGNIVCSWVTLLPLPGIKKVCNGVLMPVELKKVTDMINIHRKNTKK